jgi:hypothetical protein
MGKPNYEFIAVNKVSYLLQIAAAIKECEEGRYAEGKGILKDIEQALMKKEVCVKKQQEIGS